MNKLLGTDYSIMKERGKQFEFQGIPVLPTFHPSYILHQQSKEAISKAKWDMWHDMEKVLSLVQVADSLLLMDSTRNISLIQYQFQQE